MAPELDATCDVSSTPNKKRSVPVGRIQESSRNPCHPFLRVSRIADVPLFMVGKIWLKWMIWEYPYFRKPPYVTFDDWEAGNLTYHKYTIEIHSQLQPGVGADIRSCSVSECPKVDISQAGRKGVGWRDWNVWPTAAVFRCKRFLQNKGKSCRNPTGWGPQDG